METDDDVTQYHRTNVLIWVSILLFVIILTVIAYVLNSSETMLPEQETAQINQVLFLLAVIIAFGILFFKRSLFNPSKIIEAPSDQSLPQKINLALSKLRRNYVIVWALGEAIGIIGLINYMLTINHQYLLVFSVVSVYSILINMPRVVVAEKCIELVKENL
jgi:hypothetical protein